MNIRRNKLSILTSATLALVMASACAKQSGESYAVPAGAEAGADYAMDSNYDIERDAPTVTDAEVEYEEAEKSMDESEDSIAAPSEQPAPSLARADKSERRKSGGKAKYKRPGKKNKEMAPMAGAPATIAAGEAMPMRPVPSDDGFVAVAPEPEPQQNFNTEAYAHITENEYLAVADKPLSTFSIDVDTASYANTRRFLDDGMLPPPDAVRVEELINYFDYDYANPRGKTPFSVTTEVSDCPWNDEARLVHVGLQGKVIAKQNIPPRNLVFLLDVSGSMNSPDKLPLLKAGMEMLVDDLRQEDRVSIVVYAGQSGVVLRPTSNKREIRKALRRLGAGGSTNGAGGIEKAYQLAERHFEKGGINRVILATDGDFNVGTTSQGDLQRLIEEKRESGVFLSVLGFGTGNVKDSTMEMLADKGNGNYAYLDSIAEAEKVLVDEAGSTLVTIAKDVKIQVEFNPAMVESYRLVGYENRALADKDFNDDKKDAGEIGAGHTVTALYEVVPASGAKPSDVDPLRYQSGRSASGEAAEAAARGEIMHLKLRYKQPDGHKSTLVTFPIHDGGKKLSQTSEDFRFSAAVAEFGMLLRGSKFTPDGSFAQVWSLADGAIGQDKDGWRQQFLGLVESAANLKGESVHPKKARRGKGLKIAG